MKRPLPVSEKTLVLFSFLVLFFTKSFAQPANDDCNGAMLLTPVATCPGSPTSGTVVNATSSGVGVGTCTGNPNDDVWYRFVAVSNDQEITLSSIGSNLNTSGARIQVFQGACGGLVSIGCGTTSVELETYVPGNTYYVRVYSAGTGAITSNGSFRICVTFALIEFGKSYINISKPNSGTVETGDVLEIRASVVVRAGIYDSCRFNDVIPVGTSFVSGSLKILTNEGKQYKAFTNAYDDAADDEGYIVGSNITINLGYNQTDAPARMTRRGRIASNHKPSNFGATCIMLASYRVTVTGAIGTLFNTGGGTVTYMHQPFGIKTYTFPSNPVAIYTNYGMCSNAVGANSLGTEFNGSFGTGTLKDRGVSANVPVGYTYDIFNANGPNDYYYGVSNNTSTNTGFSTVNTWPKPDGGGHRVFSVWDIIGDHTGATNPLLGNAPAAAGANAGYMLVVNAAYRIDSAFQQKITNLCPNTYYEISCWMRNICSKCSSDSNGRGATSSGYIPTGPGDSSGITPNITFEVDGVDYYTTGNLSYTGQWVKRGFVLRTGPMQDSFVLKFFNNAPGGGGNDWALDDITVATCLPNMRYSPSLTPSICNNAALTIYDTVRSYFNNYTYYKWQRSTDGGSNWTDVSAPFGPVPSGPNPNLHHNGTDWEYVASYTVPPTQTYPWDSADKYRLIVASTLDNLSDNNCRSTDIANTITLSVITCGEVLSVDITSFNGKINNNRSLIKWTTAGEVEQLYFDIERSFDGENFTAIATLNNDPNYNGLPDSYSFTDPDDITTKVYYRIKMRSADNRAAYSRTLQLATELDKFGFGSVISPFTNTLYFDLSAARPGLVRAELVNHLGQPVRRKSIDIREGISQFSFENTGTLAPGMYILKVEMNGMIIHRKVMKQN